MIVTNDCGLKIEVGNRKKIVEGLAKAIGQLEKRRADWSAIQDAAIARSKVFSWRQVAKEINRAYRVCLDQKAK